MADEAVAKSVCLTYPHTSMTYLVLVRMRRTFDVAVAVVLQPIFTPLMSRQGTWNAMG